MMPEGPVPGQATPAGGGNLGIPNLYGDRTAFSFRAAQVLYASGQLPVDWNTLLAPPEEGPAWLATNSWFFQNHGTDLEIKLRYVPLGEVGGDQHIFMVYTIPGNDPWFVIETDMVIAPGAKLEVYTPQAAVLNVKIDGTILDTL